MSTAPTRQAVNHCPFCAEENLFPLEGGGWECRSCLRSFQVKFLGLAASGFGATGLGASGLGATGLAATEGEQS